MKLITPYLILLLLISQSVFSQDFTLSNQLSIGGSKIDGIKNTTKNGNNYIWAISSNSPIGGMKTTTNFGTFDYWVVCTDFSYNVLWQSSFGGDDWDEINEIIVDFNGDYYILGSSSSGISGNKTTEGYGENDIWVIKTDNQGNEIWQQSYGGNNNDYVNSAFLLENGNLILVGESNSDVSGSKTEANRGGYDVWLVCINANGELLWEKTIGGEGQENGIEIIVGLNEELILLATSSSGVGYEKTESNIGEEDIWLLGINSIDGSVIWDKTYGSDSQDYSKDIKICNDNIFILAESFGGISGTKSEECRGIMDYWLLKLDETGQIISDKTIGGSGVDEPKFLYYSDSTAILIGGNSRSNAGFEKTEDAYDSSNAFEDYWVICINTDMEIMWDKTIGGISRDLFEGCIPLSTTNLLIYGASSSGINFDRTVPLIGSMDTWIAEMQIPEYSSIIDEPISLSNEKFYPNPVVNFLNMDIENIKRVRISSIYGQIIYDQQHFSNNFDFDCYSKGVYILNVYTDKKVYTSKIIKQ